jgi:hypothetical protein
MSEQNESQETLRIECQSLLSEREFLIRQVRTARGNGNEREAQRWLRKCEAINVQLRAKGWEDVKAEIHQELPMVEVSTE